MKLREGSAPMMPADLATFDVDEPCGYCFAVHGEADYAVAKYHACVLAAAWRREHGVTTRSALPTRRRAS